MVWLPAFGILNVRTYVYACNCTQRLYRRHKRVCTESRLWEKNPVLHQALKPTPVLRLAFQLDTLPTELSAPRDHCRASVNDLFATGVCSSTPNLPINPFWWVYTNPSSNMASQYYWQDQYHPYQGKQLLAALVERCNSTYTCATDSVSNNWRMHTLLWPTINNNKTSTQVSWRAASNSLEQDIIKP